MPLFKKNNAHGTYKSSEYQLEAKIKEKKTQKSRPLISKDITEDLYFGGKFALLNNQVDKF